MFNAGPPIRRSASIDDPDFGLGLHTHLAPGPTTKGRNVDTHADEPDRGTAANDDADVFDEKALHDRIAKKLDGMPRLPLDAGTDEIRAYIDEFFSLLKLDLLDATPGTQFGAIEPVPEALGESSAAQPAPDGAPARSIKTTPES